MPSIEILEKYRLRKDDLEQYLKGLFPLEDVSINVRA